MSDQAGFEALVQAIQEAHQQLSAQAVKAVNRGLTVRNWLIGFHILEYEQHGADRAAYGERLLHRLAEALRERGLPDASPRTLRVCRQFYSTYPHFWPTLSARFTALELSGPIWQTPSAKWQPQAEQSEEPSKDAQDLKDVMLHA